MLWPPHSLEEEGVCWWEEVEEVRVFEGKVEVCVWGIWSMLGRG